MSHRPWCSHVAAIYLCASLLGDAVFDEEQNNIVVGGRHFWLFVFAGGPPYILYTYLMYHVYTLCICANIYIFGGPPAMSKGRPPTTVQNIVLCALAAVQGTRATTHTSAFRKLCTPRFLGNHSSLETYVPQNTRYGATGIHLGGWDMVCFASVYV